MITRFLKRATRLNTSVKNSKKHLRKFSKKEKPVIEVDLSEIYNNEKNKGVKLSDYEENYEEILEQNDQIAKISRELMIEMREIQTTVLEFPETQNLIKDLSVEDMIYFSIKFFIGSITCPKNDNISIYFLKEAKNKAKSQKELYEIEFYDVYFKRLLAIQNGNKEEFDRLTKKIVKLSENDDEDVPGICKHLIAKEMYKVGLNMVQPEEAGKRVEIMNGAFLGFMEAARRGVFSSFYYLGEMCEFGEGVGEGVGQNFDYQSAVEFYKISACFDYPRAYFRLAQFAQKNIILINSEHLEYRYTKKAAELGLIEAQHNLGVLYYQGFKPSIHSPAKLTDETRALSWFMKAGSKGYPESKYNAAMILTDGTKCKKIKKNKNVAKFLFEQLQDSEVDLDLTRLGEKLSHM